MNYSFFIVESIEDVNGGEAKVTLRDISVYAAGGRWNNGNRFACLLKTDEKQLLESMLLQKDDELCAVRADGGRLRQKLVLAGEIEEQAWEGCNYHYVISNPWNVGLVTENPSRKNKHAVG